MQKVQTSKHPYSGLARVRSAGELVVGLDQNNLPFSTAHPEPAGLDYEIAGLLAEQLGVSLRVYWAYLRARFLPVETGGQAALRRDPGRHARRSVRAAGALFAAVLRRASYRLVVRSGEGRPPADEPVAVEEGVAVRGLEGRTVRPYPSTEAVLEAVATAGSKAGYVISTRGPWLAHERWPGKLEFLPAGPDRADALSHLRGGAQVGPRLKDAIDRAWDELDRSGRLAQVFARWHIPYESGRRRRATGVENEPRP